MSNFTGRTPAREKWLDVGCGTAKIAGAVGIDRVALPGVDIVHDLDNYPWPIPTASFDHIVCNHSLSHLRDIVRAMEEISRVLRPGGIVEIAAPHFASDNFNTDPTHKVHIGLRSMSYFVTNAPGFKYSYYANTSFVLEAARVSFRQNATLYRENVKKNFAAAIGLESLVNRFPRLYERFLVYILPPSEVYFRLRQGVGDAS